MKRKHEDEDDEYGFFPPVPVVDDEDALPLYENLKKRRNKTLFSSSIKNQEGNDEFLEWYQKYFPVYVRLSYLKDELCNPNADADKVNVEEAIRRTKSITSNEFTITTVCSAFNELKELKEKYHDNNKLINDHYDIWMTTFWSLQTGDVVPIGDIKDEGASSIFHRIFEGATTDEVNKLLNNFKGNYNENYNKAYIPTSIEYRDVRRKQWRPQSAPEHKQWTRPPPASEHNQWKRPPVARNNQWTRPPVARNNQWTRPPVARKNQWTRPPSASGKQIKTKKNKDLRIKSKQTKKNKDLRIKSKQSKKNKDLRIKSKQSKKNKDLRIKSKQK